VIPWSGNTLGYDEGENFSARVSTGEFTLKGVVPERMAEVMLNNEETFIYDDIHAQNRMLKMIFKPKTISLQVTMGLLLK